MSDPVDDADYQTHAGHPDGRMPWRDRAWNAAMALAVLASGGLVLWAVYVAVGWVNEWTTPP